MAATPKESARNLRVLISAGEASGEMYGAALLDALRREAAQRGFAGVECFGLGGDLMRAAGCETVVDARNVAVVGLAEVVKHLPKLYREFHRLLDAVDARKPDIAVLIDFPDWNFRLAKQLHARGVPVVYYVSPQLWAWRKGRLKLVQKYVRKMLVIFPFEQEFYAQHGVEVDFVGHPLASIEPPQVPREEFAAKYGLDPQKQWIALLPGSRHGEVERHAKTLSETAWLLGGEYEYLVPVASTLDREWLKKTMESSNPTSANSGQTWGTKVPTFHYVDGARAALALSRAAVVASGTATLEAALMGTPFVMVYRLSTLTYGVGRRLVKVPHYGIVNLIAGKRVVPELIQHDFTAERVVAELKPLLDGPRREEMLREFAELKGKLSGAGNVAQRAARAVVDVSRKS